MLDNGIYLLGGDPNGLNFEIEYENAAGKYCEAVYSVRHTNAQATISSCSRDETHLHFVLGLREYHISLPGGCNKLFAVRRPESLGGQDITDHFGA